ncbi:MAG: hypothetical protein FWG53_02890 [Clostridiales bacterium]|nr:hypothetical protein [Clostridiales bacterium]
MPEKNADGQTAANYPIDDKFVSLIEDFKGLSYMQIYHLMLGRYKSFPAESRIQFEEYCSKHPLWGSLCDAGDDHQVFENRAHALHEHWVDLLWLYYRLSDYRSRHILFALVNNWYYFDLNSLKNVREHLYHENFDMDVLKCCKDEVFVDIGAYAGASVIKYINTYKDYKTIYCYEISPDNLSMLSKNLAKYKNITICPKNASDKSDSDGASVETTTIDEDIEEPVTFIKISTMGDEQKALAGCSAHIRGSKPKLAVSVHHKIENIWRIPRMLDEICPGYNFYLRYHGTSVFPTELSLLATHE